MFTTDRQSVLDALDVMVTASCAYGGGDRCDCKYGVTEGKWPTVHEAGNGCPELRSIRLLVRAITDDEWTLLTRRAGGVNIHAALFGSDDLASRLLAADAAASMAQDKIAEVRAALATDSAMTRKQ